MSHPAITFRNSLVHTECFIAGEADKLGVAALLVVSIADPTVAPLCCI